MEILSDDPQADGHGADGLHLELGGDLAVGDHRQGGEVALGEALHVRPDLRVAEDQRIGVMAETVPPYLGQSG